LPFNETRRKESYDFREFAGCKEGRYRKRMKDEVLLAAVNPEHLRKAWEVLQSLLEQCGPSTADEVSKLVPDADVKVLMAHIAVLKEQIDCGEIDPLNIDFEQETKAITSASE
jgi:hypothetical protein